MLYITNFSNYEEFKVLFPMTEHGNGTKSRRNRFLLEQLKHKEFIKADKTSGFASLVAKCTNDAELFQIIDCGMAGTKYYKPDRCLWVGIEEINFTAYHPSWVMDEFKGVCQDGPESNVRYLNTDKNNAFMMKAGKFFRQVLENYSFYELLSPKVINYLCEKFTSDFSAYAAARQTSAYTLHTGSDEDDFKAIYDSYRCPGNFHSCMVDDGYHTFYSDAVKATAAWLENEDGDIVARCIVFNKVEDMDTGEVLRLAERQYSSESDQILMKMLIQKLIAADLIDGYKEIGAGCGDSRRFVSKDGESWSHRRFKIECLLDFGDTISYQDSFKWYDMDCGEAYNCCCGCLRLDETSGRLESNYDEYHDEYTESDLVEVCVSGNWMNCADDRLNDFVYIEYRGYYHIGDCVRCERCGEWVLEDDSLHSDITDEYYCCDRCMERAEEEYKEENWYWCDVDDEYVECVSDRTEVNRYDRLTGTVEEGVTCSWEYLDDHGHITCEDGTIFLTDRLAENIDLVDDDYREEVAELLGIKIEDYSKDESAA